MTPLLRPLEELIEKWRREYRDLTVNYPPSELARVFKECTDELERVLRDSGLAELLEAGQAMRDTYPFTGGPKATWTCKEAWDRALAKVKGKSA